MSNKREIAKIAKEVREIKAELNKSSGSAVARVTVYGGETYDYDASEIRGMLDNKRMYRNADNLPRWLKDSKQLGGGGMTKVWEYLEKLEQHTGSPVIINVRQDKTKENNVPRLG